MSKLPYPIADYRVGAQYPKHNAQPLAWRWEFLRRNAEYQAFHEEHHDGALSAAQRGELLRRFGMRLLMDPRREKWQEGNGLPPAGAVTMPDALQRIARSRAHAIEGLLADGIPAAALLRDFAAYELERYAPGIAIVYVDTTAPINSQLREAKDLLNEHARHIKTPPAVARSRTAEWRNYLRVLDGRAAGATFDAIAAAVRPTARNTYPDFAARKWADAAYAAATRLTATLGTGMRGSLPENYTPK